MAGPIYNATTPQYDRLHYNHSIETAALLQFLEAEKGHDQRSVMQMIDPQGVAFERLIQHACNIFSEQSNRPTNVCWMQFFETPSFIDVANRIRQQIHEIRTGMDGNVENGGKLILPGNITANPSDFYNTFIQPGLTQVSTRTIVFILDFTLVEAMNPHLVKPVVDLLEILARTPGHTGIKVIVALKKPLPRLWQPLTIDVEPLPEEITDYFQRRRPVSGEPDNYVVDDYDDLDLATKHLLTPLRFLNSGAEKEIIAFLGTKWTDSDERVFWPLIQERLVKQLVNRGVALEQKGLEQLKETHFSASLSHQTNNCKTLSFHPPELLLNAESGLDALRKLESSKEFMVDALTSMMEAWRFNDTDKWDFVLNRFTDAHAIADYAGQIAISRYKIVLSYLTQIIISREDLEDHRLFRALEMLTGMYAEAVVAQQDCSPEEEHEAARSYYNLYYLMDRTSSRRPQLFSFASPVSTSKIRKSYARHSARYQGQSLPPNSSEALRHSFHLAWYQYDSGNIDAAADTFFSLAQRCFADEDPPSLTLIDTIKMSRLYAYDCAGLAFSIKPSLLYNKVGAKIAGDILKRYGGFTGTEELSEYLHAPKSSMAAYLPASISSANQHIVVHFSHYDWMPALQIADSILFDLGFFPLLSRTENGGDFTASLSKPALAHVVLGSPDSPGEVGDFVSNIDKDLANVYQSRLGEDFYLPIPAKHEEKDVVVLMGSGVRCIADSWASALSDSDQFPFLKKRKQSMPIDIFATVLGAVLKKSSQRITDMVIDQLTKRIKKRLDGTPDDNSNKAEVETAVDLVRTAAQGDEALGASAQDRLAELLPRPQKRELMELSQPLGVVQLVQGRLDEIRDAGADAEPHDLEDVFKVLVVVADSLIGEGQWRRTSVQELEIFRSNLAKRQKEFHTLGIELSAGEDIVEKLSKLETTSRTMVNNFAETIVNMKPKN